jgi:hypothetical protein
MKRPHMYILDDRGEPVPTFDPLEWGRWFETAERHVAHDMDEGEGAAHVRVSTVFLGLDHNFWGNGPPILWETLVFGGPLDGEMDRYTSRADALRGHQAMCRRVSEAQRKPGKHQKGRTT